MSSDAHTGLSELEARVYRLLNQAPDTDVPIYLIYEAAYQINIHRVQKGVLLLGIRVRPMQQRLGSVISRTNGKLEPTGSKIVPGELRHTYRLKTKAG